MEGGKDKEGMEEGWERRKEGMEGKGRMKRWRDKERGRSIMWRHLNGVVDLPKF